MLRLRHVATRSRKVLIEFQATFDHIIVASFRRIIMDGNYFRLELHVQS